MAAAGFYYLKRGDVVRCIFCGVEVGQWVDGDDPMVDHRKWSPACKFVRSPNSVGNIPIEEGPTEDDNCGFDTCGPYGVIPSPNNSKDEPLNLENLGVQKSHPPSFPAYSTYESRLQSYKLWPISLKLRPEMLSDAGFFYTGIGDKTICFHCGGGLKDWEETDEPWVEHARWFSKCIFILLMKGKDFVDEVSGKKLLQNFKDNSQKGHGLSSSTSDLEKQSASTEMASTSLCNNRNDDINDDVNLISGSCSKNNRGNDATLCKICYMNDVSVVFLPCGHLVACVRCAASLTACAVCRKPFTATIRAYLS
ncbi:hypothetical protein AAG570_011517 [Ranatra chinensis]|uniref:RING-type domain-containing protein n=1 Tax=Ranatra chinensis TaxID=642074 RepID=A0ABD0YKV9_9HEMI